MTTAKETTPSTASHFAEGSGRFTAALILAVCVAFASITAYVFYSQKPPVASGAIAKVAEYPIHSTLRQSGGKTEGVGGGVESMDEVLVLAEVNLRNASKGPLFLYEEAGTLTTPIGEQKRVMAASASEVRQAYTVFPQLGKLTLPVIPREATLQPGQSVHGLMLFAFPIKQEEWETRRSFDTTLSFRWQRALVLEEPKPATGPAI